MAEMGVKLYGAWVSPFSLRVEWALKLKGVEYEYVHEDLPYNKSPELLRYNPVYKKVPVLVHDGKPLSESSVIIEYIDDTWNGGYPILPLDPYERAQARFWVKFADDKLVQGLIGVVFKLGKEQQSAVEELQENLRVLEGALQGSKFFGGESIGYVDILVGWIGYWILMAEEVTGVSVADEAKLPAFHAWSENFLASEKIRDVLPPFDRLVEFNKKRREQLLAD